MNKFIPLSSLKDTTGIIELCNKEGEPVVVNSYVDGYFFLQSYRTLLMQRDWRRKKLTDGHLCDKMQKK